MKEYDFFAPVYDQILYFPLKGIRRDVTDLILKHNPDSIVDICCGTGDQLKKLEKRNRFAGKMVGIDLSESMLKVARNQSSIDFQLRDATDTKFESCSFDLAITSFALHEKSRVDAKKIVEEVFRILKQGGVFIIADYLFTKDTLKISKLLIHIIERIAGKEHYSFFKSYQQEGQLIPLMDKFSQLSINQTTLLGSAVWVFKKNTE